MLLEVTSVWFLRKNAIITENVNLIDVVQVELSVHLLAVDEAVLFLVSINA